MLLVLSGFLCSSVFVFCFIHRFYNVYMWESRPNHLSALYLTLKSSTPSGRTLRKAPFFFCAFSSDLPGEELLVFLVLVIVEA